MDSKIKTLLIEYDARLEKRRKRFANELDKLEKGLSILTRGELHVRLQFDRLRYAEDLIKKIRENIS